MSSRSAPAPERRIAARPAVYLYRAAAAHVRVATQQFPSAEAAARAMFGDDVPTDLVLRAAADSASITDATWAGALAAQAVNVAITANFLGLSTAPLTARLRAGIGWPSPTQAPALLGS